MCDVFKTSIVEAATLSSASEQGEWCVWTAVQEELLYMEALGTLFVLPLRCLYDYAPIEHVLPNPYFSKISRITKPFLQGKKLPYLTPWSPPLIRIPRLGCDANVARQNPANPQTVALYPLSDNSNTSIHFAVGGAPGNTGVLNTIASWIVEDIVIHKVIVRLTIKTFKLNKLPRVYSCQFYQTRNVNKFFYLPYHFPLDFGRWIQCGFPQFAQKFKSWGPRL